MIFKNKGSLPSKRTMRTSPTMLIIETKLALTSSPSTHGLTLRPQGIVSTGSQPLISLCRKYPHMCKFLGTIPSNQLQYAKVPFWKNIQIPLSKHSWELQIIVIWNTNKGRVCLNAHNKDWLKELAKEIPKAKWETKSIHNHPYQTALGSGQHSGLNKINKLPNDHPSLRRPRQNKCPD